MRRSLCIAICGLLLFATTGTAWSRLDEPGERVALSLGSFVDSDFPAARLAESQALDINDANVVVGFAASIAGEPHAFQWADGIMRALPDFPGVIDSGATAINATGDIVGQSTWADGKRHATLWRDDRPFDLGTLGGTNSMSWDINDAGAVTGWSDTANGERHAFLWQNDRMTDLGTLGGPSSEAYAINGAGMVVGMSLPGEGAPRPFLWHNGVMQELSSGRESLGGYAVDVNEEGTIVGVVAYDNGLQTAALWRDGELVTLLELLNSGVNPAAVLLTDTTAIDATGAVLGAAGDQAAAIYVDGEITLLPNIDRFHSGGIAQAVNANGWIVGLSFVAGPEGPVAKATIWVPPHVAESLQSAADSATPIAN